MLPSFMKFYEIIGTHQGGACAGLGTSRPDAQQLAGGPSPWRSACQRGHSLYGKTMSTFSAKR